MKASSDDHADPVGISMMDSSVLPLGNPCRYQQPRSEPPRAASESEVPTTRPGVPAHMQVESISVDSSPPIQHSFSQALLPRPVSEAGSVACRRRDNKPNHSVPLQAAGMLSQADDDTQSDAPLKKKRKTMAEQIMEQAEETLAAAKAWTWTSQWEYKMRKREVDNFLARLGNHGMGSMEALRL